MVIKLRYDDFIASLERAAQAHDAWNASVVALAPKIISVGDAQENQPSPPVSGQSSHRFQHSSGNSSAYSRYGGRGSRSWHRQPSAASAYRQGRQNMLPANRYAGGPGRENSSEFHRQRQLTAKPFGSDALRRLHWVMVDG